MGEDSSGSLRLVEAEPSDAGAPGAISQTERVAVRPIAPPDTSRRPPLTPADGERHDNHHAFVRPHRWANSGRLPEGGPRVSVVIPTLNEEQNLPHVFCRLPRGLHEVIVVDGHSTDATVATARRLWRDVCVITQSRHGKGNALAEGFGACTGEIIVALDADGSTDAAEIPRFVAALCNGADFVKGSRFAQGGASSDITFVRSLGNRALNSIVNALYRTHYSDLCYGYNAFWARCLPYIRVDCEGFEVETLINVRIAKAGLVVHEVPSNESRRIHGKSHLRVCRDGSRVLRTIAAERLSTASRRWVFSRLAYRVLVR
jgi:glycosyltransferase involved in cell wall biosynthesis